MKTNLTPEQSDRLIELGVDPMLASCEQYVDTGKIKNGIELPPQPKPVFKLTDILSLLPTEIKIHRAGDTLGMMYHCGQWRVGYSNDVCYCDHTKVAPELIDALFELLCWVLKNHPDKIKK